MLYINSTPLALMRRLGAMVARWFSAPKVARSNRVGVVLLGTCFFCNRVDFWSVKIDGM